MGHAVSELRSRLQRIDDLDRAGDVLSWDQNVYMPDGGAADRGRQMATLEGLSHGMWVSRELGEAIDAAAKETDGLDAHHPDRVLVRLARRDRERKTRLPDDLVSEIAEHVSVSYTAWTKARPKSDFAAVRPYLEKTVELSRRYGECFADAEHVADPLIDEADPGMTAAQVRALFAELREQLVPLVKAIGERPKPDNAFLRADFDPDQQIAFVRQLATAMGYDFERGRLDLTHHPFMTRFGGGDIRITTRFDRDDATGVFFSSIHEAGHALYEQGIDRGYDGTPLGGGTSTGVHESQSRLWENIVGRSRPFWEHFYPEAQQLFPAALGDVDLDAFHRGINRVEPSLIRVDADEVTYNLHVMIRFDLALAMLEGELAVADLPDAWNARYESDLGVRPENDAVGCMQDVHWYTDKIGGMFQGYTLGNVMSAQFFAAARRALPELDAQIGGGQLAPLREWLTENLYQHGSRYTPNELVERATGAPLSIEPFMAYLREKFGRLYGLAK